MGNTCSLCGKEILWGHFAFNQEICWDCFSKDINDTILLLQLAQVQMGQDNPSSITIGRYASEIKYMLASMAEFIPFQLK